MGLLFNDHSEGPVMVAGPPQSRQLGQFQSSDTMSTSTSNFHHSTDSLPFPMTDIQAESPPPLTHGFSSSWASSSSSLAALPRKSSRKRSRDEYMAADDEYPTNSSSNSSIQTPAIQSSIPEEEFIYGEGMALINPRTNMIVSPESQTGTWYEEKAEAAAAAAPPISVPTGPDDRPDLPSRKSQRLDTTASGWDDITLSNIQKKLQSSTQDDGHRLAKAPSPSPEEPQVDNFTHLLGISWQRISTDDKYMAAAIRGWEKYIDNHFSQHLSGPEIILKHRGLNAYLVSARGPLTADAQMASPFYVNGYHPPVDFPGHSTLRQRPLSYYLFTEDLNQAQLVGKDWNSCVQNLRSSPIAYEPGSQILRATEKTPERVMEDKGILIGSVSGNGVVEGGVANGMVDVEMGMDMTM